MKDCARKVTDHNMYCDFVSHILHQVTVVVLVAMNSDPTTLTSAMSQQSHSNGSCNEILQIRERGRVDCSRAIELRNATARMIPTMPRRRNLFRNIPVDAKHPSCDQNLKRKNIGSDKFVCSCFPKGVVARNLDKSEQNSSEHVL